jgi:hypothetical protein
MAARDRKDHKDRQEAKRLAHPKGGKAFKVLFALRSVRSLAAELLLFGSEVEASVGRDPDAPGPIQARAQRGARTAVSAHFAFDVPDARTKLSALRSWIDTEVEP